MSKTPLTDETPSDRELEVALRHAVQVVYQTGDLEQLTVKRMRKATEEELELPEGFFKESTWKDRSKAIIENEVVRSAPAKNPVTLYLLRGIPTTGTPTQRRSRFVATRICQPNPSQSTEASQTNDPV